MTITTASTRQESNYRQIEVQEFRLTEEPFYLPVSDEVELFEVAYEEQIPVLLKGPTGCGKTRFVEYMSWRLHQHLGDSARGVPLITVACHEDLSASDLIGRYLLEGDDTVWIDGPITRAVKAGAICYLDEIVEARKDTTVLIHPLTDYRRQLPIDKRGELLQAAEGFLLVLSYNPGYQSALKDLKHSTRQRFVAIEFNYPPRDKEAEIVRNESGCTAADAMELAKLGEKVRNLKEHGLAEGVSTRPPRLRRAPDLARHPGAPRLPDRSRVGADGRPGSAALDRGGRDLDLPRIGSACVAPRPGLGHPLQRGRPRDRAGGGWAARSTRYCVRAMRSSSFASRTR